MVGCDPAWIEKHFKKALAGEGNAVLDEGDLRRVSVGVCNATGCVVGAPIEQRRSVLREIVRRETGFSERAQNRFVRGLRAEFRTLAEKGMGKR